jgi:nickel-dependent lactate racemase
VLDHTDASRPCPDAELLAAAAAELERAGIRQIRLLCALGAHRPPTPAERRAKLGALLERYDAFDHDCTDASQLADLGTGPYATPLLVNRLVTEADVVVSTGIVEPHQYAGYSGGPKTLAIGAGGEATIAATHSPPMIERPGCGPGLLADNPFQEVLGESARLAGLSFIINVVPCGPGWAYFAGAPQAAHQAAVAFAARLFEVPVSGGFEVAICGVPHPKSASLYQASRAASYLALSPRPVLAPGAALILACTLEEGAGQGPGERRFLAAMQAAADRPEALLAQLRRRPLLPGEQRAFVMGLVLSRYRVIVASRKAGVARQAGFEEAASIEEALEREAIRLGRPPKVLILPEAISVLPCPGVPGQLRIQ